MRIGAVMTVAGSSSKEDSSAAFAKRQSQLDDPSTTLSRDVLGQSLLDRTVTKLTSLATVPPSIVEGLTAGHFLPRHSARRSNCVAAWEDAVATYIRDGIDHLLLLRVKAYHELDYSELFHFHLQTQSALTQVQTADGSLDIAFVSAAPLRNADSYLAAVSALIPRQRRFVYRGHVNWLRDAREFYRLIRDGLSGRRELMPIGEQVRPGVWLGAGARLDSSATIGSPVFIGAGSRIAAGCTIGDYAAIERDCEIDCGTSVTQSWILQNTYIGMALNVRRSVVNNAKLFHLDHDVEVRLEDGRLVGPRKKSGPFRAKLVSFFGSAPVAD